MLLSNYQSEPEKTVKNNEGYVFTFHRYGNRYSVKIKDKFGLKLGKADNILLATLSEDKLKNIQEAAPHNRDAQLLALVSGSFDVAMEQAKSSIGKQSFKIHLVKKNGENMIIFDDYGLQGAGYGLGNVVGSIVGTAQVGAGLLIVAGTGGFAAPVGSALIGSGINGTMYSLRTDADELSLGEFATRSATSAVAGGLTGGLGAYFQPVAGVAGEAAKTFTQTAMTSVSSIARTAAVNATGHVGGAGAEAVLRGDTKPLDNLTPGAVLTQAVAGALGSEAGGLAKGVATQATENFARGAKDAVIDAVDDEFANIAVSAFSGGAGGAAGAVVGKGVSNVVNGNKEGITSGMGESALLGGTFGAVNGARKASNENERKRHAEEQKKIQAEKQREREQEEKKKSEATTSAKSNVVMVKRNPEESEKREFETEGKEAAQEQKKQAAQEQKKQAAQEQKKQEAQEQKKPEAQAQKKPSGQSRGASGNPQSSSTNKRQIFSDRGGRPSGAPRAPMYPFNRFVKESDFRQQTIEEERTYIEELRSYLRQAQETDNTGGTPSTSSENLNELATNLENHERDLDVMERLHNDINQDVVSPENLTASEPADTNDQNGTQYEDDRSGEDQSTAVHSLTVIGNPNIVGRFMPAPNLGGPVVRRYLYEVESVVRHLTQQGEEHMLPDDVGQQSSRPRFN